MNDDSLCAPHYVGTKGRVWLLPYSSGYASLKPPEAHVVVKSASMTVLLFDHASSIFHSSRSKYASSHADPATITVVRVDSCYEPRSCYVMLNSTVHESSQVGAAARAAGDRCASIETLFPSICHDEESAPVESDSGWGCER